MKLPTEKRLTKLNAWIVPSTSLMSATKALGHSYMK